LKEAKASLENTQNSGKATPFDENENQHDLS